LKIFTAEELESRYHVRLERYVRDMLIEMHTVREMVDTMVLPAAFDYAGSLIDSAARAKGSGVAVAPQVTQANKLNRMIGSLQKQRDSLETVLAKAEGMHDALEKQAKLLTSSGADAMSAVRECCDALELSIADNCWPLPKYREMLFPI
jgi:glutamine synthetase